MVIPWCLGDVPQEFECTWGFLICWARFRELFRCTSTRDAQGTISSQIIVCSAVLTVPGGFPMCWALFGDYYGAPQHVYAQKTISSPIIIWSAGLTVSGGFSTRRVRFWGLFRCTSPRSCPGDDYIVNHSLKRGFDCTWGFPTLQVRFWGLFRCSAIPWCPGDNFLTNLTVPDGFFDSLSTYCSKRHADAPRTISSQIIACSPTLSVSRRFFELLRTLLRIISVYGDMLMPRWRFILNLSVPTARKDPQKTTFPKMFPWFCSAFHLESCGMAVGYLLKSGTGWALAARAPTCCFSAGSQWV